MVSEFLPSALSSGTPRFVSGESYGDCMNSAQVSAGRLMVTSSDHAEFGAAATDGDTELHAGLPNQSSASEETPDVPGLGIEATLERYHALLVRRFDELHQARSAINAPVFALEHGLDSNNLKSVQEAVRAAVEGGIQQAKYRRSWLPLVVYAAEIGYQYSGNDFWPPFTKATPGWEKEDNYHLRDLYVRFARDFGGAEPYGAFARQFNIIAWPITHAVLPKDLQVYFAELMFNVRARFSTALLDDPDALGYLLQSRAGGFTERLRVFCDNTALVGRVAASLLRGQGGDSPFLSADALERLVRGLEAERQSRSWLSSARQAANRVRLGGFLPATATGRSTSEIVPQQHAPDPTLSLRRGAEGWKVYVELPDLRDTAEKLPDLREALRFGTVWLRGRSRPLSRGQLLRPQQGEALDVWPPANTPLLRIDGASDATNTLLGDFSLKTPGPWWVFKEKGNGEAVEIRRKSLSPGGSYIVVHEGDQVPPLPWVQRVRFATSGVSACRLIIPRGSVDQSDASRLEEAGLSFQSKVIARPVGVVPDSWDGQGAAECVVGHPLILAIGAEAQPTQCRLFLDGRGSTVPWPATASNLMILLDDLRIGSHLLQVDVQNGEGRITKGLLDITVREPHERPDEGAPGEGIRVITTPTRPSFDELWEDTTTLEIHGPHATKVRIEATLWSDLGEVTAHASISHTLPVDRADWRGIARELRESRAIKDNYDNANSCTITVTKAGIGFASLTCERPFKALAWKLAHHHRDRSPVVRLIDQTDGSQTTTHLYDALSPLAHQPWDDATQDRPVPSCGGLLEAISGETRATVVVVPDPNELMAVWRNLSKMHVPVAASTVDRALTLINGFERWQSAQLTGDPFARGVRDKVTEKIGAALRELLAGRQWCDLDQEPDGLWVIRQMDGRTVQPNLIEARIVINSGDAWRGAFDKITNGLWQWVDSSRADLQVDYLGLVNGFAEIASRVAGSVSLEMSRFLITLADDPGRLSSLSRQATWDPQLVRRLLKETLQHPEMYQLARVAVSGLRDQVGNMDRDGA